MYIGNWFCCYSTGKLAIIYRFFLAFILSEQFRDFYQKDPVHIFFEKLGIVMLDIID